MEPNTQQHTGFVKADRVMRGILQVFVYLSAIALTAIMLVAFINVCGEKLAGIGVSWAHGIRNSNQIIQYLHIPLVFLAAGYVTLDQGHTRIDLLIHKFPRAEKIAALIGHLLGAAISFFVSYRGVSVTLVKDLTKNILIAQDLGAWKEWPFTVCHCLGFFMLGVSFLWAFIRMILYWKMPGVDMTPYIYPKGSEDLAEPENNEKGASAT